MHDMNDKFGFLKNMLESLSFMNGADVSWPGHYCLVVY